MDPPLELTFRDVTSSVGLEVLIREFVTRLGQRYDQIMGCCVAVEVKSDVNNIDNAPDVRIDIQVPGEALLVRNQNGCGGDVLTAVRHSFDSAARQIEEYKVRRYLRMELCGLVDTPQIEKREY